MLKMNNGFSFTLTVHLNYKQCHNFGTTICSMKPLSRLFTSILSGFKTGSGYSRGRWESYVESEHYEGVLEYILSRLLFWSNSIKTFDFYTIYTTISPIIAFLLHMFYLSRHVALTEYIFVIYCRWPKYSFFWFTCVNVTCWAFGT